jgi:hypothetical protein
MHALALCTDQPSRSGRAHFRRRAGRRDPSRRRLGPAFCKPGLRTGVELRKFSGERGRLREETRDGSTERERRRPVRSMSIDRQSQINRQQSRQKLRAAAGQRAALNPWEARQDAPMRSTERARSAANAKRPIRGLDLVGPVVLRAGSKSQGAASRFHSDAPDRFVWVVDELIK